MSTGTLLQSLAKQGFWHLYSISSTLQPPTPTASGLPLPLYSFWARREELKGSAPPLRTKGYVYLYMFEGLFSAGRGEKWAQVGWLEPGVD